MQGQGGRVMGAHLLVGLQAYSLRGWGGEEGGIKRANERGEKVRDWGTSCWRMWKRWDEVAVEGALR